MSSPTPRLSRRSFALAAGAAGAAATLALGGCGRAPSGGGSARAGKPGDQPLVLTTFTVIADIASAVAGDALRVESLTKPGTEIHTYDPTPKDIQRASEAALILDNGLNLEMWFAQFMESIEAPHVVVSEGVKPIAIALDAYKGKPNPHAWMSPRNVQIYVDNIAKAFTSLDPGSAVGFTERAAAYKSKLAAVEKELVDALAGLPESQRALVTCEGAFSYLTRDVGMHEKYIWPVNAEDQATPKQISSTIEFVKSHHVPAVFCESTVPQGPMMQVVHATGARFGGVLYVDSLSEADGPVPTYLDLIRHDASVIIKAMTGGSK